MLSILIIFALVLTVVALFRTTYNYLITHATKRKPTSVPDAPAASQRPNWNEYWLGVANAISKRADCSRRRVGAVIVDGQRRVVSSGYNGSPPGGPSCLNGDCPRSNSGVDPGSSYDTGPGACIANHAEANAIIWADPQRMIGATLYITCPPCEGCQRLIAGVGIAKTITS